MKQIIIIWDEKSEDIYPLVKQAEKAAIEIGLQAELFPLKEKGNRLYERLKEKDADYLMTFDMAGFENDTLQEMPAYNILYAKQIHILLKNDQKYQRYLRKNLALNLFLFVADRGIAMKYKREFPHILNLEEMPTLKKGRYPAEEVKGQNEQALKEVIRKVCQIVEAAGLY